MKISDAFPSSFLKCSDLQGRTVNVIVSDVTMEDLGDAKKPVVHFRGKDKGFVLNKTTSKVITQAYGDDTDDWIGKTIQLYPTETEFKGDMVECIRVRIPKGKPAPPVEEPPPIEEPPADYKSSSGSADDDPLPF